MHSVWGHRIATTKLYKWIEMFNNGRTCVMDAERSGRPSTATTDEKPEEARAIILTDRRVTVEEIALQLGISQGTAYSLVHDILGFHKVAARRVGAQTSDRRA